MYNKSLKYFRFILLKDIEFNYTIYIDIMYIVNELILYIINKAICY